MKFEWDPRKVEIKGNISLSRLESSVGALSKIINNGDDDFYLKMESKLEIPQTEDHQIPFKLTPLLEEFRELF